MKSRAKIRRFGRLSIGCLLPCLVGVTRIAAADNSQSEQDAFDDYFGIHPTYDDSSDWKGHFSIGAVVGLNINASFKENGVFKLNSGNPAAGIFDDGYVRPDSTGSADGYTTYWGYNNASQYNAAQHTLTYHSTTSYQTSDPGARSDGGAFPGFDLDYGGSIYKWDRFRIGWDLGFDLLPMSISDNHPISASVEQSAYTFNTGGITMPGAGYTGPYNGAGVPLLPTQPQSTSGPTSLAGTITGTRKLDMMLYAIRLGPTFYWDFCRQLSVSVGGGVAMGIVSAEYKYDETITTSSGSVHSSGSFNSTDIVYGGDANASLIYHTSDEKQPVDLYLTVQYMPLTSADFSQGGRDGHLDLSGQVYISAGVNWPF